MAKAVYFVALALTTSAWMGHACTTTIGHAGFCWGVAKGTAAAKDGVFIPDGTPVAVKKGSTAPHSGMSMPGCSLVKKGDKAKVAGFLLLKQSGTATAVKVDDTAKADGVLCPPKANKQPGSAGYDGVSARDGYACQAVSMGQYYSSSIDGVFFQDGPAGGWASAVKSGATTPSDGFWCPGCVLTKKKDPVSEAGRIWSSLTSSGPIQPKGEKFWNNGEMYCPDSVKGSYKPSKVQPSEVVPVAVTSGCGLPRSLFAVPLAGLVAVAMKF